MKKLIVLLILVTAASSMYGQVAYIGAGYNIGYGPFDDVNYIIGRYNETRVNLNLDPEMEDLHRTEGLAFEFGMMTDVFQFGMSFQYNRAMTFSRLIDEENIAWQRDLSLRTLSFAIDSGLVLGNRLLVAVPGFGVNFLPYRFLTRTGQVGEIEDREFMESSSGLAIQGKVFVKFFLRGLDSPGLDIMIEPFIFLKFAGGNLYELNADINPDTWIDDSDTMEGFQMTGIRLLLVLKTG
jgi:hypothetical protein